MTPKDISGIFPSNSVFQKWEAERVAKNIAVIMEQANNEWKPPTFAQYKKRRIADGNYSDREELFFNMVIPYFKSEDTARLLSPNWNIQTKKK